MAKLKIALNDPQNLRDLLQEAYNLASEQIVQIQNEINKMVNSTRLQDEPMEAKSKFAKSINDYLGMKDKAISKKIDIAKILADVSNHNGNIKDAFDNGSNIKSMDFNFDDIKKMVDEHYQGNEKGKTIQM